MPKLEGPDASLEISLKEYGFAWKIGETETRFYYGIKHDDSEYVGFDWADLENNLDMRKEYDWANFKALSEFTGIPQKDWEKMPLIGKIQDLNSYYGYENIFGSTCGEPMTYEEVIKEAD
jgi:hypothetical protein